MARPVALAIPMGDPAGIGPEIILSSLSRNACRHEFSCVVAGDVRLFRRTASDCSLPWPFDALVSTIEDLLDARKAGCSRMFFDMPLLDLEHFTYGRVDGQCGKAAYDAIALATDLTLNGFCQGMVTPPIHKESLRAAHVPYIGHTEILGSLCNVPNPVTMFETLSLKVFFLTRHMSLRHACDAVKRERLLSQILQCDRISRTSGFLQDKPLAVAALNPHGGEHGLFGDEEMCEIMPAIEDARAEGVVVDGPVGADSVFHLARMGRYRAVLSLYHDQGHIATKTLDFERTVSVTWGLPFIRTSVDHGTAFDIAGTGKASPVSMKEAISVALKYLSSKNNGCNSGE